MAGAADIQAALVALRHGFDAGFAMPARPPPPDLIPLLVVRVGGAAHAIALADLMSFTACGALVRLPRQRPECLGLTAFRGKPIPVFNLAALLGRHAQEAAPRWLAVTHAGIGFAVAELVGLLHLPPDDLRQSAGTAGQRVVALASGLCPVVELAALFTAAVPSDGSRTP
jgi:purine-binding chemotaxis protein CheW